MTRNKTSLFLLLVIILNSCSTPSQPKSEPLGVGRQRKADVEGQAIDGRATDDEQRQPCR